MEYTGKNAQVVRFLGIIVLIVLLAGLTYWHKQANQPKVFPRTDAIEGQVISGFPEELLMGAKNPKITQSYSIDYGSSSKQYTADYVSKDKLIIAYLKADKYLRSNNYVIVNERLQPTVANIYGTKPEGDVNIVIQKLTETTSQIIISTLVKGK
ncbi:MAG: hypothetical protein ACYC5G_00435 [Candidatus Doudnabacteria bacterium]